MVRGKQTAVTSTGEKASRKELVTKASRRVAPKDADQAVHRKTNQVALREILKFKKSTKIFIRRLPFQRLMREVAQDFKTHLFQPRAILDLQESTEEFL